MIKITNWLGLTLWVLLLALSGGAQTNDTSVRIAIVSESPGGLPVIDLLTAELSRRPDLQLLEREEIQRVYREQQLSAGNRDMLKLGQVLGADGLLLFAPAAEGTNRFMTVQLVAVKPGVILASVRAVWPVRNEVEWIQGLSRHFDPLFAKLTVKATDAIPISVVNLRSAVKSQAAQELERQLTLLTIERLARERELFVLERRRLDRLSAEKELQPADESAFWNGSYLLEGTLDRDGYSRENVVLSARLVPPQGGVPMPIEIAGSRTNLSELINQLAVRVKESLQLKSPGAAWSPAEEAAKYFEETKWALKWGMFPEAQAAAEAAWSLGKQDIDSAYVRVKSYIPEVPPDTSGFETSTHYDSTGRPDRTIRELHARHPLALVVDQRTEGRTEVISYLAVNRRPDPVHLERAVHLLALYNQFGRTLPPEEPRVDSPWYQAGIEALTAASQVLRYYHLVVATETESKDQLAELRALAREAAELISRPLSVRSQYWVGDRVATHDELAHTLGKSETIFRCKLVWGSFWQDKPADCIALYRELMSSAAFRYLHSDLWLRPLGCPRVTAWSVEDQKRAPAVWQGFVQELKASTNFLHRMEASALEAADAKKDADKEAAVNALYATLYTNAAAIVSNNVELLYLEWGIGQLIGGGGIVTPTKEKLQQQFYTDQRPRLQSLNNEYWAKSSAPQIARASAPSFDNQKQFLQSHTPYDFRVFAETFRYLRYTKEQATELQPLVKAYISNLLAQADGKSEADKAKAKGAASHVRTLELRINNVLNPPPIGSSVTRTGIVARPNPPFRTPPDRVAPARETPPAPPPTTASELFVSHYVKIPTESFKEHKPDETVGEFTVLAHRFHGGQVWLDVRYHHHYVQYYQNGSKWMDSDRATAAAWNPQNNSWSFIPYPKATAPPNRVPFEYFEIANDALYVSGWDYLRRYQFKTRQWDSSVAPWQKYTRLFAIGQRVFAANDEAIFEILDGGRGNRVLASCRRRPVASALDSRESLGDVRLFAGPGDSLRASAGTNIFTWDGKDWTELPKLKITVPPKDFAEGTVLISGGGQQRASHWWLPHDSQAAELWRVVEPVNPFGRMPGSFRPPVNSSEPEPRPVWRTSGDLLPGDPATAAVQSNLFFLVELRDWTNAPDGRRVAAENHGRHANLVCLDRKRADPVIVPLKFDVSRGPLPFQSAPTRIFNRNAPAPWTTFTPEMLLIGHSGIGGFWVIPRAELEKTIASATARP